MNTFEKQRTDLMQWAEDLEATADELEAKGQVTLASMKHEKAKRIRQRYERLDASNAPEGGERDE
ncbi:MAG: hypothetical protein AAF737_04115 [Pseudomonadota bacterium]